MKLNHILILLFPLLTVANVATANNKLVIKGVAPKGVQTLSTVIDAHDGMPVNKGHHGLRKFCYITDTYVVYSKNFLGSGYKLLSKKPKDLKCAKSNNAVIGKNKMGMYIGMPKREVEKLLNIGSLNNMQTIIWQSKIEINGKPYDLQTYIELSFKQGALNWLTAFTTTTY